MSSARETLRLTEQTVLLYAATAYMNLLRDTAILDLQRSNVEVLQEQLRQTRDRFNVGEVTRTDVAQAESRLAAGRVADADRANPTYTTSRVDLPAGDRRRARHGSRPARRSTASRRRTLAAAIAQGAGASIRRSLPRCSTSTPRCSR